MRYLLYIIITLNFFSCKNTNSHDKYIQNLPDSTLINNIISTVIQIDTLKLNYDILKSIKLIKIYSEGKLDLDGNIPPPPPSPQSIAFEKLFKKFKSDSDSIKRLEDSVFICLQTDTSRKIKLKNEIYSKFNHKSENQYVFYLPIFSFDKQFVFVKYWINCGGLCGNCNALILKKYNNKWIKAENWCCGIR